MSKTGVMNVWTSNRQVCFNVGAVAMPQSVSSWMDENADELDCVLHRQRASPAFAMNGTEVTLEGCLEEISKLFSEQMEAAGCCVGTLCGMSVNRGSRTALVSANDSGWGLLESCNLGRHGHSVAETDLAEDASVSDMLPLPVELRTSTVTGFQLASNAGPMCEEPVRGVVFVLHGCRYAKSDVDLAGTSAEPYGPISGQIIAAMKEACRYSLFRRGFARISEAMLSLEVTCEQEILGKVYGVLGKRQCKIVTEGLREGTSLFHINSFLPLAESFGLAHDLRTASSGYVAFHCAFSHWETSEEDPFQEASLTPDEIEELGEGPLPPNRARKLISAIRKRKGLQTDEKVISVASKQRTVTRNK